MACFEHDGVRSYYTLRGNGKPFVFLHGLGGNTLQPENTLGEIKGYQCIFLDQRAHGNSSAGDFQKLTYAALAEDVFLLARHLGIKEPFPIGGISMGAAVSIKTALLYPQIVEKLVLVRPAIYHGVTPAPIPRWYTALAEFLERKDAEGFFSTRVFAEIEKEAPLLANTFKRLFTEDASLRYPQKYRIIPRMPLLKDMKELEQIQVPVLILANHFDTVHAFEYAEEFHAYLPQSRLFEVTSKAIDPKAHCSEVTQGIAAFLNADDSV